MFQTKIFIQGSLYALTILLFMVGQIETLPLHSVKRIGVAEVGHRDNHTGYARAAFYDWNTQHGNGALLFADAHFSEHSGARTWVGLLQQIRAGAQGLQVSHNIFTAGLETYGGIMLRATVFDGTLHAGPLDINVGVTLDTGFLFFKHNAEIKFLGVGLRAGAGAVDICVMFCLGVNWDD